MNDASRIAGWHGKLPSLGDFATRRLDAAFVDAWDAWLSAGLSALRTLPGWLDAYLASPVWRFLLLSGVLPGPIGERAWAGVLMPSVDRVGRYYPLTIALPLPALPADTEAVESLWRWLVRLDEAAADALHEDWSIDMLEAELQRLPLPEAVAGPRAGRQVTPLTVPAEGTVAVALGAFPHAGALLAAQAAAQAADAWAGQARGLACWSAQPDLGDPRLLASRGLDRARLVASLFGPLGDNPR